MPISPLLLDTLRCPLSGQKLEYRDDQQLTTVDGQYAYPLLDGIPWMLARPRNSLLDWASKLKHFQQTFIAEIAVLELDCKRAEGVTSKRLQALLKAKKDFLLEITQLVQPLTTTKVTQLEVYNVLRDRAPNIQNLLSYEANIYRDWAWGAEENAQSAALLESLAPEDVGRFCVIGAGACKLALDLHLQLQPEFTVATDINPLFLLAVRRLLENESLVLTEFPLQPKNLDCVAVRHELSLDANQVDNFFLCFADAAKPAFEKHRFDTVLTPWLIDIQPYELARFLKQLNQYLPVGGCWLNFGSLVFNQGRDALCYSRDEIESVAEQAGFSLELVKDAVMPYLKSPYNAGHRVEQVWAWRARKLRDVEAGKDMQVLPDWLLDTQLPVPVFADFEALANQSLFNAELLSRFDGQPSIAALARKIAQKYDADCAELEQMLVSYLIELWNTRRDQGVDL